jgi:hypothetical protein
LCEQQFEVHENGEFFDDWALGLINIIKNECAFYALITFPWGNSAFPQLNQLIKTTKKSPTILASFHISNK